MADLSSLVGPVTTAIEALPSGPSILPDEFRRSHRIPPGAVRYQLELHQIAELEESSSEVHRAVGRAIVRVWARPVSLSVYTRITMLADHALLYAPAWWRAITGVYSTSAPREEERPTISGAVVVYAMTVELHMNL